VRPGGAGMCPFVMHHCRFQRAIGQHQNHNRTLGDGIFNLLPPLITRIHIDDVLPDIKAFIEQIIAQFRRNLMSVSTGI